MQTLTQPTLLLKPFAEEGDKNTLPIVNTDATQPQKADLTNGFPAITSLPPDQGGLPPERKDYNALGYLTTSYDWFYQCGGAFTFNQVISDAIGGYPIGARLWYTDASGTSMILRSTIENNTNNFLNDDTVIGQVGENKPWVIENFMGIKSQQPLLSFNWFDHEPDDSSWLLADTWSWQDGTVYKSAYQALADAQSTGVQSSDLWADYKVVGSPTITNGVVSNFSTSNYVIPNYRLVPGSGNWSIETKVNTSGASGSNRIIVGSPSTTNFLMPIIRLNTDGTVSVLLTSNGTSWDISLGTTTGKSTALFPLNQDVRLRLSFDGTKYTVSWSTDDWETQTDAITVNSSSVIYQGYGMMCFGNNLYLSSEYWNGSISMIDTYITVDGVKVWQGAVNVPYTRATNGWKIVSPANAGYVQDMYESTGVAWYYILDTANTQFKLPRTKFGFVGLRDTVGKYVPESLPNLKGDVDAQIVVTGASGVFSVKQRAAKQTSDYNTATAGFTMDASQYSLTYQDNAPVQQRATQMYLYFYVGNTVRNQSEIDVGAITEALNKKWDSANMKVVSELPENPQTGVFYFVT